MITTINEFKAHLNNLKINEVHGPAIDNNMMFDAIMAHANEERWFQDSDEEEIIEAENSLRQALHIVGHEVDLLVDEIKHEWMSDTSDPMNLGILKDIIQVALDSLDQ